MNKQQYNDFKTIKRYFLSCETLKQLFTTYKILKRWRVKYGCYGVQGYQKDDMCRELVNLGHKLQYQLGVSDRE